MFVSSSNLVIDFNWAVSPQGALYLNCVVVGAFFHPVKKVRRNDELRDVPTSDVEREAINMPMAEAIDEEPKEDDANQVGQSRT